MSIGDRIKQKRQEFGWSQMELANKARVSQQLITRLETGKVYETKKIVQLAKAFGMTVERFLSDDPWENGQIDTSEEHAPVVADEPITPKEFGVLLRGKREALKLTQLAVADWLGVTKGAVSHWENGRVEGINPLHMVGLVKILKLEEADIRRFPGDPAVFDTRRDLPPLPHSDLDVIRLYAALPESLRAHVRGIIEALADASAKGEVDAKEEISQEEHQEPVRSYLFRLDGCAAGPIRFNHNTFRGQGYYCQSEEKACQDSNP